uniref:Protein translocase subunit SecA n=1 Tax=Campylaephora sungminbooi TaxID=1896769 RepID=A0A1B0RRY1_9FLOR|nr:preprotein translocase subunit SecA [Campylaephora sungminbooi]AKU47508.1 preprotein translocase subunit SecA [Campylaephora sungminbooi]ALN11955.1 preprotein translocase subunit SecA [Campylaephora sungminbooi]
MFQFLFNNKVSQYQNTVQEINKLDIKYSKYSNNDLHKQTEWLKKQLSEKTIDEIIPECFAIIKEAIKRATNLILFDVQIIGAIILHEGKIAEMKTGEGKTLVAIIAAYLNSLFNQGVHIITVNEYLAKRDANLARQVFKYLNITIGIIEQNMNLIQRKQQYQADITYLTNSELGFDYLRDNMAINKKELVQRNFFFAIVDEIDSILIDEARTPLIISGPSDNITNKYIKAKEIANNLELNQDYEIDEKSKNIILSEQGINKCEKILNINNLYDIKNPWVKYIINALKAKNLFLINKDYIIKNNEIVIVDEFTGRIMEGRRWSDGLHQAIEAKENQKIQQENKTLASITYQNLFLLYTKLSGMTGTAKTEEAEFDKIYNLQVIEIPTNKKNNRKDLADLIYKTEYNKWQAIANECFDMYQIGRPTLVGTTSIEKSEFLASILNKLNIPYNLLNAKPENISRESEIISQAGRKFTITIATNMAGRGTDIILGGNPYIISKIELTNYIQSIIMQKYIYMNNEINQILKTLDANFINNHLKINNNNLNDIIDELLNTRNIQNTERQIIGDVYIQLVNYYNNFCELEKQEIIKLGGLYVIGTERHESRRIDNQLRGRSGRQGDPGSSRFFLSLQDNLIKTFGGNQISKLMENLNIDEDIPIESMILNKSLNSAQKKVEAYFYDVRKQLFEYDDVINNQRQAIYTERKRILKSIYTRDCILEYAESTIEEILNKYDRTSDTTNKSQLLDQIYIILNLQNTNSKNRLVSMQSNNLKIFFIEQLRITYDLRETYLEQLKPGLMRQLEKYYLLQQIDYAWQEHLEKMLLLKESIGWRSYGQQDPLTEYKNEAFNLFINMVTYIRQTVIYLIMRSRLITSLDS